jgi:hypothetical protein
LIVTPASRIMNAETIQAPVPQRCEHLNQERLAKWDPNVIHRQITTTKILEFEVLRLVDRLGVLTEPLVQDRPGRCIQTEATFSRSCGNRFSDIDWTAEFIILVLVGDGSVGGKSPT